MCLDLRAGFLFLFLFLFSVFLCVCMFFFAHVGAMIQISMKRNQINNKGKQKERQMIFNFLKTCSEISTSPLDFFWDRRMMLVLMFIISF